MSAEKVHSDGELPAARRELEDAVAALTEPRSQYIDGRLEWTDSLYIQLQESLPGNQGAGQGQARSLPPAWLDAMETLHQIDSTVSAWQKDPGTFDGDLTPGHPPTPETVRRLRLILNRQWRPQDCDFIEQIVTVVKEWVADIEVLFVNEPVRALWAASGGGFAACPHCDKTMAKKRDRCGEMVQYPALQVLADGSTRCMACKTSWGPQLAMWVCRQLGYPTPAGVLE
jgi:hypothetical protein